jgi:hypothetical protein
MAAHWCVWRAREGGEVACDGELCGRAVKGILSREHVMKKFASPEAATQPAGEDAN